jgi:hypothetical protein
VSTENPFVVGFLRSTMKPPSLASISSARTATMRRADFGTTLKFSTVIGTIEQLMLGRFLHASHNPAREQVDHAGRGRSR